MPERTTADIINEHRKAVNDYNDKCKQLAEIRKRKAFKIIEMRTRVGSDKQAERLWDVTDDGQLEIELSLYCKGIEKIISSLNSELHIIRGEQWGIN